MILLLKAIARVLAFMLLVALAAAGLLLAIFCIQGGAASLSLPKLAQDLSLPQVRDAIAGFLSRVEGGTADGLTVLGLVLAILAGLAVLAGLLVPRRDRVVTLASEDDGRLLARRGALGQAATALAEQADGVTRARVRVRPRRTRGGSVRVRADRTQTADPAVVERAIAEQLEPLTAPLALRSKITTRVGGPGARVQ